MKNKTSKLKTELTVAEGDRFNLTELSTFAQRGLVFFQEVDTGNSDRAAICSNKELTEEQAQEIFEKLIRQ